MKATLIWRGAILDNGHIPSLNYRIIGDRPRFLNFCYRVDSCQLHPDRERPKNGGLPGDSGLGGGALSALCNLDNELSQTELLPLQLPDLWKGIHEVGQGQGYWMGAVKDCLLNVWG